DQQTQYECGECANQARGQLYDVLGVRVQVLFRQQRPKRPYQPGRRQISARTQATKSIDSSYLRMLYHLGDYADPSSDCAGLSKDPFLRPSSTRTGRSAYVAHGSKAPMAERPVVA